MTSPPRPGGEQSAADLRTRTRVHAAVAELGPVSAARLADSLGLTGAAVRRHLDAMVADGVLESREPSPGRRRGRGRPAREFVVSSAGHDAMASGYDELALAALSHLAEVQGAGAVADFAERRFSALGERLAAAVDPAAPAPERVQALAQALTAQGHSASARPVGRGTAAEGTQLCQGHCPVRRVAEAFPELCEAERRAFERVLGARVQRLATLAHGDHVCTTFVPHEQDGGPAPSPAGRTANQDHLSAPAAGSRTPTEGRRP
ncbi:helix-turn-helix transcriptional regulator [Kineococcus indalonis]|uniref:helix-turn-helix transcriptional regulator n=1 Tax=Kineococcus indalonis TaxID=2696566 RepID=UPI002B1BDC05|nr:transcriptional regulator [Kineococcus indalonis]